MKFKVEHREIELFGNLDSNVIVLLNEDHGEGREVYEACRKAGTREFILASISGIDWEHDLSPWRAPAAFKKAPEFTGGADEYICELEEKIVPAILKHCNLDNKGTKEMSLILAGYSLAGLFALYSSYQSNLFDAIVTASGSMWYPDFLSYAQSHQISENVKKIYFSVGDKEANTKNQMMQPVEENTRVLAEYYLKKGIQTTFELNEGGHFVDDAKRVAKGIIYCLA